MNYTRIAGRLFNRPLAITPQAAHTVLQALAPRFDVPVRPVGFSETAPLRTDFAQQIGGDAHGACVVHESGVAVVPIMGELVARGNMVDADSGILSFEQLQRSIRSVAEDARVRSIVLDVQSPGGEVSGMIETGRLVAEVAKSIPVHAVANDMACSAAYCAIAGATSIYCSQFAMVGHIGALMMHTDMSRALAGEGLTVTLVHAGARKADGSPFSPLNREALAEMQGIVGKVNDEFTSWVAQARGVPEQSIRALESRALFGAAAVKAGLADGVATLDEIVMAEATHFASSTQRGRVRADMQFDQAFDDQIDDMVEEAIPDTGNQGPGENRMQHRTRQHRSKAFFWDEDKNTGDSTIDDANYSTYVEDHAGRTSPETDEEWRKSHDVARKNQDFDKRYRKHAPQGSHAKATAWARARSNCTTDMECQQIYGPEDQVATDSSGNPIRLDDPRHPRNGGKKEKDKPKGRAAASRPRAQTPSEYGDFDAFAMDLWHNEFGGSAETKDEAFAAAQEMWDAESNAENPPAPPQGRDEVKRIEGILDSDEAQGREMLARTLAFRTRNSVAEAKAIMASAPRDTGYRPQGAGAAGGAAHSGPMSARDKGAAVVARVRALTGAR